MPRITAIELQKKNKKRVSIFLDGRFAFGIDENAFLKNQLKINQNLTEDQVEKLIKENISNKLMDLALRFLSYRPRSQQEVAQYIAKKIAAQENIKYNLAYQSPLVDKIISKLKRYDYLNDIEFAKWWVSSRTRSRPKGRNLIKLELLKKGVDKEVIESVLENSASQQELAIKALEKKLKRWENITPLELKKKVYQYLGSRGFDFDTIKETFAFFVKKR